MTRIMRKRTLAAAMCATVLSAIAVFAANPETYTVVVGSRTQIVTSPPNQSENLAADSDADVVFPVGTWEAVTSSPTGATLTLAVNTAFRNTQGLETFKRDCELGLALNATPPTTGSNWTVTAASDVTDYAGGDETASVEAVSDNPGRVWIDLTVTFKTLEYDELSEGNYVTQVTGTITAN